MHIAFVIENVRVYSGGRVHGWLMIQALLALGHRVSVYTQGKPPFFAEICELEGRPDIVKCGRLEQMRISSNVDMVCSFPILATAWAHREAKRLHKPHVAWVLDPYLMCKKYAPAVAGRMHYGAEYKTALRSADWIIASDDAAVEFIRQWSGNKKVVPWTPSINSVIADAVERGVKRKHRHVVAVTRLTEHKNFEHVVEALRAVSCTGTVITSFDAGRMRARLKSTKLDGRVSVVDKPDDWEKFRLFWEATVFLSASQYEGLGLPQMEGMYVGCKPVVYDFPVMREICGDVAEYARWRDSGSLTDCLRSALQKPETARVQKAGQRYSFGAMLKRAPSWILP